MNEHRYPADLVVTLKDLMESGWKDALANAKRIDNFHLWQAFSGAARVAAEEGRAEHGKVLWLLADACSMMLATGSPNEPFRPYFVMDGKRSALPIDFTEQEITFFEEVVDSIDNPWLKSRLSDVVWLMQKPRKPKHALAAIDAYRAIQLDADSWIAGGREGWARAIGLARMLKGGAGDRLGEMEREIVATLMTADPDSRFLGLWLADLLKDNGLGAEYREDIAKKLESLSVEFKDRGELYVSRDYFSAASWWFEASGDIAKAMAMLAEEAEGWVREAVARTSGENPSYLAAASDYEKAIQTYRKIPRDQRENLRVDERLGELRALQAEAGAKSVGEMRMIRTQEIDISRLVENARNHVLGKSPKEALLSFSNLSNGADYSELYASAEKQLRDHPLSSMMAATVLSRDGRVIAKRPGMNLGGEKTADDEIAIKAEMVRNFGIHMGLVVQGQIWPAHEVLLVEHRLSEGDFVALARRSPLVPPNRERLFGKALFKGFEHDWASAIHLLAPQVEHMVRFHLKQAGAKTTNLDASGIENENGLSTLMELPEAKQVFGEDLVFEIQAIFCDPFGPNLRNEVAHGLLDDDQVASPYVIYAWWFALRLTFNMWWNAARHRSAPEPERGEEAEVQKPEAVPL